MLIKKGKFTLIGILWLCVLVSAIAVVYVTFDVRRYTQELAQTSKKTQNLQIETGQLLLEKSALAAYARVERIATEQLNMRVPTGHEIVVVNKL
jgi:cell division protein FtsL